MVATGDTVIDRLVQFATALKPHLERGCHEMYGSDMKIINKLLLSCVSLI